MKSRNAKPSHLIAVESPARTPGRRKRAAVPAPDVPVWTPELILLAFQPPVMFHRSLVVIGGGVLPALLLSCLLEESSRASAPQDVDLAAGWFSVATEVVRERTAMAPAELDAAIEQLRVRQLLENRPSAQPGYGTWRIDHDRLLAELEALSRRETFAVAAPPAEALVRGA